MKRLLFSALLCAAVFSICNVHAAPPPRDEAQIEMATRLQVFLDRAGFGPGKIDGRFGEFTMKAANLYLHSIGKAPIEDEAQARLQKSL